MSQRRPGARHDSLLVSACSLDSVGSFGRLSRLGSVDCLISLDSLNGLCRRLASHDGPLSLPLGAIHERQLAWRCSWTGARRARRDG